MATRPRCANCGKPAAYSTKTETFRLTSEDGPPEVPVYSGNLQVTRQTVERHAPDSRVHGAFYGPHIALVTRNLWDGESYRPLYDGLFCTLRCALGFATASYRAGYRKNDREAA